MKKFRFQVYDERNNKLVQSFNLKSQRYHPFAINKREYTIGRQRMEGNHIAIEHATISRQHAKLIIGTSSVSLQDMGSGTYKSQQFIQVNGSFKDGNSIKPNQVILLQPGIEIKFAEAPYTCQIEFDLVDEDSRSRSREVENKATKTIKAIPQAADSKHTIKKENQIWNMGDLNEAEKHKMMKLMGVKDNETCEKADLSKSKQDIKFRNYELERQFQLAVHHTKKTGLGL